MDGNQESIYEQGEDVEQLHQGLVDQLKQRELITDPRVEAAFRAVPRHLFLPALAPEEVYRDEAIPTKMLNGTAISSSSQPAIMAIMLEQLQLQPGQRVLEIGAGTGYNAALLAHIVGETGQVVTIDIDEDIVADARTHLAQIGFERVQVICADGGNGYLPLAPYDRIILTVSAGDITPAWREQLKPDGMLLLPLKLRDPQVSVVFEQVSDHLASVSVRACGFMMLRGAFAEPTFRVQLGPDPLLFLGMSEPRELDTDALYTWLTGPSRDISMHLHLAPRELFFGLHMWLALHEPDYCQLVAERSLVERGTVPQLFSLFSSNKYTSSFGLLGESGICVLSHPPLPPSTGEMMASMLRFEILVKNFGPDETLASRLLEHIATWNAAGRPTEENLHINAYPHDSGHRPSPGETILQKQWTQLVISWQSP